METPTAETIMLPEVYRFLAQSMRYPEPSWLDQEYLNILSSFLSELHLEDERQELSYLARNWEDFMEDLQVEYTRLFINAVPHVLAPPYASVYTKGDGQLYGKITEKTREFYRFAGFDLLPDRDLPDHLVNELEFLALLAQEQQEEVETFMTGYFRSWFPLFHDRVLECSDHIFYKIMVHLIDFFTREEQ